jgi:hypothetical protein
VTIADTLDDGEPADSDPTGESPPPYTSERRDGSVTEQWDVPSRTYRRYDFGALVVERPFNEAENASADQTIAEAARRATQLALLDRARTDLATNQAFLDAYAAGTATTDDAAAQVAELTRQAQGFIRLTVGADLLQQLTQTDGG